ncbi:MAG: tRNA lysidine(34) synthetase TilS [Acidimicrobiales bacterium]|nr:tRNA lysidine(34) synthetase TilS [Acidimicrobiales bacterium]
MSGAAELVAALLARCSFPPPGTAVTCGVSGGPDSLALLVLAAGAGCAVTAVHVDHGLRHGSSREAEVVAATAGRVGAGFRSVAVSVPPGPNLEARARQARHGALPPGTLLGHTADDQAETVLVNLLRGAGLDGLAGMRPGRRPLLALRRRETRSLCAALALDPVDDPSNADPRHLRNRVRAELLPLLDDLAGRDVAPILARQAALLRDDADLLDGLASAVDPTDARAVAAAPAPLGRRAVRAWLRVVLDDALAPGAPGRGERHPPAAATVARVRDVAAGRSRATEVGRGVRVERRRGRLSVARAGPGG